MQIIAIRFLFITTVLHLVLSKKEIPFSKQSLSVKNTPASFSLYKKYSINSSRGSSFTKLNLNKNEFAKRSLETKIKSNRIYNDRNNNRDPSPSLVNGHYFQKPSGINSLNEIKSKTMLVNQDSPTSPPLTSGIINLQER